MWSFVKRHKNKLAVTGLVGVAAASGLYLVNKYVETQISAKRQQEQQAKMEQLRKQQQFENTQRVAENTLSSVLSPCLLSKISEVLNTDKVLEQLKEDDSAKIQLWQQLKVLSFGKCVAALQCGVFLSHLAKIQFNILGGYAYNNNNNNQLTAHTQEKFLSFCQLFVDKRVQPWIAETLMPILSSALDNIPLTEMLSYSATESIFKTILAELNFAETRSSLLSLDHFDWSNLTQQEISALKQLIAETLDIIECQDFQSSVELSMHANLGRILSRLFADSKEEEIALAKLIPKVNKMAHEAIWPKSGTNFFANIFDTFCLPKSTVE